jgi:hypothetical protein
VFNLRFWLDRIVCSIPAFCAGWLVYMVAAMVQGIDGFPAILFAPIMAGIFSGIFVALSLLFGLILLIPFLRRWWTSTRLWAILIASLSILLLCFGYYLGISDTGVHPETGKEIEMLHPLAVVIGYWSLIFAIANWPVRKDNRVISFIENWVRRLAQMIADKLKSVQATKIPNGPPTEGYSR